MNLRTPVACLRVVAILLTAALTAAAQSPAPSWNNVKALTPGTEARVVVGSRTIRGAVRSMTDDSLILDTGTGQEMFTRQEVVKVSVKRRSRRGHNALVGLAIGAVVGAIVIDVPAASAGCGNDCMGYGRGGGALGAAVYGAVIGAVIPTGRWREIYKR